MSWTNKKIIYTNPTILQVSKDRDMVPIMSFISHY